MYQIQKRVKEFCVRNNLESPIEHRVLDTLSELGEVAKEILKMTDYGRKELVFKKEIEEELGDLFYSLITIANYFDINLETALDSVLRKYELRLQKSGTVGNEN